MVPNDVPHRPLLLRVAQRIAATPSDTDQLMLSRWRILTICQHLLGQPVGESARVYVQALESFADEGLTRSTIEATAAACAAIRSNSSRQSNILPVISDDKRDAVERQLMRTVSEGSAIIERASLALLQVHDRLRKTGLSQCLPGIVHRLHIVASVLQDPDRSLQDRVTAAGAVLYVHEIEDVIPDELGAVGMLDDDYALRIAIEQLNEDRAGRHIHWSEQVAALWDDMPFLQGVTLTRSHDPIKVSWLDRVNSYVAYSHVMELAPELLLMIQPSITCSPLHTIVSLSGLLALEAATSPSATSPQLKKGQLYDIDGFVVRFDGLSGDPTPGWLHLAVHDGKISRPPSLAERMVPVSGRKLSRLSDRRRANNPDPLLRFMNTEMSLSIAGISRRLVLVTARHRAQAILRDVESNGVQLLDHGFVRFCGTDVSEFEPAGALILVVPTLSVVRELLDRGVDLQTVIVDGYARLHCGRYDLPFLLNRKNPPTLICWSVAGYHPVGAANWMPPHQCITVSDTDIAETTELDNIREQSAEVLLRNSIIGEQLKLERFDATVDELRVVAAIDDYLAITQATEELPEFWSYQLRRLAISLRVLVRSTPARWEDIRRFASTWRRVTDEKWDSLRDVSVGLHSLREAEGRVIEALDTVTDVVNSRATALQMIMRGKPRSEKWRFVCERVEQESVVRALIKTRGIDRITAVNLPELSPGSNCMVAGWINSGFARRIWAHAPNAVCVLADASDCQRWEGLGRRSSAYSSVPLLSAVRRDPESHGLHRRSGDMPESISIGHDVEPVAYSDATSRVSCVFIWLARESEVKILPRDGKVLVESGDAVHERRAVQLRAEDRVILGLSAGKWSPSDEFTEAVVDAVRAAQPQLVSMAKEWRHALAQIRDNGKWSSVQLQRTLASVGVEREVPTIEGWLRLDRASPIAPRGGGKDLQAIWPLLQDHTTSSLDDVIDACAQLRNLRTAAGTALLTVWKGMQSGLAVSDEFLEELVSRLRHEVHAYEVEAVTAGSVPMEMLGWWVPVDIVESFESASGV